jgi:hypothetical protein
LDPVVWGGRVEGVALGLVGKAKLEAELGRGGREQTAESLADPRRCCRGRGEHEAFVAVDAISSTGSSQIANMDSPTRRWSRSRIRRQTF